MATGLAKGLEERSDNAAQESSTMQSAPDVASLLGVLAACEEQTAAFDWNLLLHAVAAALGISLRGYNHGHFPGRVFCEAAEMFPILQHFPLERIVTIYFGRSQTYEHGIAISALVVWAHHVLGLNVLVKRSWYENGNHTKREIPFNSSGNGLVIIEETESKSACSTALLKSSGEYSVTIKPRAEESEIVNTIQRTPAKGFGTHFLSCYLRSHEWSEVSSTAEAVIVKEMQIITTAFAQLIAGHLRRVSSSDASDPNCRQPGNVEQIPCVMNRQDLLQAAGFLFDMDRIDEGEVELYKRHYVSKPLDSALAKPPGIDTAMRNWYMKGIIDKAAAEDESSMSDMWQYLITEVSRLSLILIALPRIVNLRDFEELKFCGTVWTIQDTYLQQQLPDWNGTQDLSVNDDTWLEILALLITGDELDYHLGRVCLVSHRGWSLWISTFETVDPYRSAVGAVFIGRGSPCRKGIWKKFIKDAGLAKLDLSEMRAIDLSGQRTTLRCASKVFLEPPYCGTTADSFLLLARFRREKSTERASWGYRHMHEMLWSAHTSRRCNHQGSSTNTFDLPMSCATIEVSARLAEKMEERIVIALTAKNIGARWLSLATVDLDDNMTRQVLLRGSDCCYQCVIGQAAEQGGKWFIIL